MPTSPSPSSGPRRLALVPPPADDTVVRSADPDVLGARPAPAPLVRAVAEELVEAAVTIGEDVEEIVEETVGEVLAAGGRSLRVLREAAHRLDAGRPVTGEALRVLTALHAEAARSVGSVAGTSLTAGRHAVGRAGVAASRLVTALLDRGSDLTLRHHFLASPRVLTLTA